MLTNTLFITDIHIQTVYPWEPFEQTKEIYNKLNYWLSIRNKKSKKLDLYLGGDVINAVKPINIYSVFYSFLNHLLVINDFIKSKGFELNKIFYIFWNHEYYIYTDTIISDLTEYTCGNPDMVPSTLNEKMKSFYKRRNHLIEENKFNSKKKGFGEIDMNVLFTEKDFINPWIYKSWKFIMEKFFDTWLYLIFWLKKENIINLSFTHSYPLSKAHLLLGNTLFSPYKWHYNPNFIPSEYEDLFCVNDFRFWDSLKYWKAIKWLVGKNFPKSKKHPLLKEVYERYQKASANIKDKFNYAEVDLIRSDRVYQYTLLHTIFLYNFLSITEKVLELEAPSNIKGIDILTHFPFNYFDNSLGLSWKYQKIENKIEKYNLTLVNNYSKKMTNTYFNVNIEYFNILVDFLYQELNNLEVINFYCWHTHIQHKMTMDYKKIKINIINASHSSFCYGDL